jgi:hypothetical protein
MKKLLVLALLAVSAFVAGCEEPKKDDAGAAGTAAPVALTDKDVPLPADFDDEAEKQITTANYKQELDTLEKEISAE